MPWKLIEDLRDGNINLKEVLKNQARFKLDLSEIKTGCKKSSDQKDVIKMLLLFLIYEKKNIDFFRDYAFLLSAAKYKVKYGEGLKI